MLRKHRIRSEENFYIWRKWKLRAKVVNYNVIPSLTDTYFANQLNKCQPADIAEENTKEKPLRHILFMGSDANRNKFRTHRRNKLHLPPKVSGYLVEKRCTRRILLVNFVRNIICNIIYNFIWFYLFHCGNCTNRNKKLLHFSKKHILFPWWKLPNLWWNPSTASTVFIFLRFSTFLLTLYLSLFSLWSEAATGGVLLGKVFLNISQNSQKNTSVRVSFLIKLQLY